MNALCAVAQKNTENVFMGRSQSAGTKPTSDYLRRNVLITVFTNDKSITADKKHPRKFRGESIDAQVFDLSDLAVKRNLQIDIGTREGAWRVTVKPARALKTSPQLGYYFAVIVKAFADFMREHDPSLTLKEASDNAHYRIKEQLFSRPIVDQDGRVIATKVRSVADADIAEMSKLIDSAIDWLGSEWQIAVPPPSFTERTGQF